MRSASLNNLLNCDSADSATCNKTSSPVHHHASSSASLHPPSLPSYAPLSSPALISSAPISFARTFQLSQQKPVFSRVAVNKSVSDGQMSTQPRLFADRRRERSEPPELLGSYNSLTLLGSSSSENRLNGRRGSPLNASDTSATDDASAERTDHRVQFGQQKSYSQSLPRHFTNKRQEDRIQKLREMKNQFLGLETVADRQPADDQLSPPENSDATGPRDELSSRDQDHSPWADSTGFTGKVDMSLPDREPLVKGVGVTSLYSADSLGGRLYRSQSHEPESGPLAAHLARNTSSLDRIESGAVNTLFLSKTKTGTISLRAE